MLNPSPRARSGVVELVVPADGPAPADVQVLSERSGLPGSMVLDADTVRTVLGMLQGPRISDDAWIHDVRIEDTEEGIDITIAVGTEEKPDVPIAEAKQDVYTRLGRPARRRGAGRHGPAVDPQDRRPHRPRCPATAGRAFEPAPLAHPVEVERDRRRRSCSPTGWCASTSTRPTAPSRWTASPATAGWSTAATSATPTTTPRRGRTPSSTRPHAVTVRVDERGPVRARVRITRTYDWPDHVDGSSQARVGEHQVDVDTDVEVRADEATVRVTTSFVNPSGDHRLRVHLPLPEPAAALAGRERLHRRDPGPDGRGPARRVRAPDRARPPLRHAPGA